MTSSAFSLKDGKWDISWPGRTSQHDVVCLSPPLDPMQGIPIGNGDIGALVWCEPRKLCIAVNKSDLWDDSPDERDGYQNDPDGHHTDEVTTLRHGCRLELDLGMPFMDSWYLKDFEARLDIARGMAVIRAATPFGTLAIKAYVSVDAKVLVVECDMESGEAFASRMTVEHWGSRTGQLWFSILDRDPSRGLAGTSTGTDGERLLVNQRLRKLDFTVATAADDNGTPLNPVVSHSRGGHFETEKKERHSLRICMSIANSEENSDTRKTSLSILDKARLKGTAAIEKEHIDFWRDFWQRAYIRTGNDILDNLWHLAIYYAGASQRGRYPALFTQGLWSWNRDFQPWNHYFHWNQQQLTWPLPSSGHPELMRSYLEFRYSQLPMAKEVARRNGKPGAYYGDVSDRSGHTLFHPNRTPGGQISADFWRHYRFSGDDVFLKEKGWPVILEVARWHMSILEHKDDGLYHTTPGWAYEGGNMLKDCTSELIATRRVFEIATECATKFGHDEKETAAWHGALEHLAPIVTMESPVNPGVEIFAAGYQKGIEKDAGKAFCGGFKEGDAEEWAHPQPTCAHDPKRWGQIFCDTETSPIFPDGRIGLSDKGSRTFELALNTAAEADMHWTRRIVLARLGLANELWDDFSGLGKKCKWKCSCFGFTFDDRAFWETAMVADPALNPKDFFVKDYNAHPEWEPFKKSRIPMRMWEFRRIAQEGIVLLATAMAEALLQSHDGVIRIAPAIPDGEHFAFTLMAAGGFHVSSEGTGGNPEWIHIESVRGESCVVATPWRTPAFLLDVSSGEIREITGANLTFNTVKDSRYLLSQQKISASDWRCMPAKETPNNAPKRHDENFTLGIPRMF